MTLTPSDPVLVRFTGGRAAEGPVTLGQLNILTWLAGGVDPGNARLRRIHPLRRPARIDDVVETVQVLLARHEGLRSSVVAGDPPIQRVAGAVELAIAVYTTGDQAGPDQAAARPDLAALSAELHAHLSASPPPPEVPWRVAVVTRAGLVLLAALDCSHLVADQYAMTLLDREFGDLVAGPGAREVGRRRHQPLDQASDESRPRWRRRAQAALSYWAGQLERMPACLYALPRAAGPVESGVCVLTSVPAAEALRRIATRTGLSRPSAVFASVCAVLAQRGGYEECVVPILSGNRFDRTLTNHLGTLTQLAIASVDVAGAGFDELTRRAWLGAVQANSHGLFDVREQQELVRRAERRRGVRFALEPVFNNVTPDPAGAGRRDPLPPAPAGASHLRWRRGPAPVPTPPRFDLFQYDPTVVMSLTGAGCGLPRAEVERLLRAVERLLVAAGAGDLAPERIRAAMDLPPLARGPGWRHVDGCWVELGAAQQVLDEALGPSAARLFATVDDRPLVAFLPASDSIHTPQQAHERTLAALTPATAAMAPSSYVVCEGAPARPADLAAWRRRPVIAAGSGRAPPG